MDKKLLAEFRNPPSLYRGKPFWAWNGKLASEELRRQIRIMKRMGLGGFFMHSRVGLDTAYLSKEWFECVDACADEAKKQKMEAWLYDEDRWPSGAAGGLVTKNPRFRGRSLKLDELPAHTKKPRTADTIALFSAKVNGTSASDFTTLPAGSSTSVAKGRTILRFRVEVSAPDAWYNDQTYLDTLNPDAVREFIKVTHEAYRKNNGAEFGKSIPGIFTDEPNYGNLFGWGGHATTSVPWTGALPGVFRKRYGYNLTDHLPALFFDTEDPKASQVRYHFVDCITHLFVTSFSKQIGEWCGKNRLQFTGHMLSEEMLSSQTTVVGSALRHYEYMQAPGMDLLCEGNREYDTAKGVSSVAHQFNRRWRLTETYGCTGWDFAFEGHKALGDWQAALGINLRCQHLSWYTMLGQAKRDYPAGIFYQSPWWELYPHVEDYFGRVGAATTRGEEVRDILVIHPVESVWLHVRKKWQESGEARALDRMVIDLRSTLLAANLDFDYGDEDILSRHGRVAGGDEGPRFVVAKASYKVVVVPPLHTIRASTVKLLAKFVDAGGTVVQAGPASPMVDAVESNAARELAKRCVRAPAKGQALADAVGAYGRRISIAGPDGTELIPTLHLLRRDRDNYYLFVVNTSEDFRKVNPKWLVGDPRVECRTTELPAVTISGFGDCDGAPVELDAHTGELFAAKATRKSGQWHMATSLPRLGSRLFVIPRAKSTTTLSPRPNLRTLRIQSIKRSKWDITLSEHNVLALDRPLLSVAGKKQKAAMDVLRADKLVRDALGIRHRGGAMVQPWAREKHTTVRSTPVTLRYTFSAATIPSGDLLLALEKPTLYRVSLNGTTLDTATPAGWWVDKSLETLRVDPATIRIGENELVLECDYREDHPGLEIVYLLGTFGVKAAGTKATLTGAPSALAAGNWVRQGLPFYSGHVTYSTTLSPKVRAGERCVVQIPSFKGAAVRVLVNGAVAGIAGWPPYEIDITEHVTGKPLTLGIQIVGHRRNSHGPLHRPNLKPSWTGPWEFENPKDWCDEYCLVPCGMMEAPKVVVRR